MSRGPYRSILHLDRKIVGLANSGRHVLESSASVVLQRSGSTAAAATVRGRVFSLLAGQWEELLAQPFEIAFPVGQADVELALQNLSQPGRQPLREFLVRLESATGVELSDFTACRLWVLDDETLPGPGEMTIVRFGGIDEQDSALLLGQGKPGQEFAVEYRQRLQFSGEYLYSYEEGFPALGPVWLRPVPTDGTTSIFFRMHTP